jgi:hypothetical protein
MTFLEKIEIVEKIFGALFYMSGFFYYFYKNITDENKRKSIPRKRK